MTKKPQTNPAFLHWFHPIQFWRLECLFVISVILRFGRIMMTMEQTSPTLANLKKLAKGWVWCIFKGWVKMVKIIMISVNMIIITVTTMMMLILPRCLVAASTALRDRLNVASSTQSLVPASSPIQAGSPWWWWWSRCWWRWLSTQSW